VLVAATFTTAATAVGAGRIGVAGADVDIVGVDDNAVAVGVLRA